MSNTTKIVLGVIAAVIVVGGYFYPGSTSTTVQQLVGGTGTAGSTFGTAKYAGVIMTPSAPGTNATTSSILNSDATDRYVLSTEIGCETLGTSLTAYTGAALASLTVTAATSSATTPAVKPSIRVGVITISTSTPPFTFASSSQLTATSSFGAVWSTGSYMTFDWNATNTATCTVGVRYIGS